MDGPETDRSQKYDAFEFCGFMQDFLQAHPEVVEDQQRGWDIYWNPGLEPWPELPVPDREQAAHEAVDPDATPADRSDSQS